MSMEDLRSELAIMHKELEEMRAMMCEMRGDIPHRKLSDEEAEADLIRYVRHVRKSKTSSFEMSIALNLPVEQIERMFQKLEKEGRVGDADD